MLDISSLLAVGLLILCWNTGGHWIRSEETLQVIVCVCLNDVQLY